MTSYPLPPPPEPTPPPSASGAVKLPPIGWAAVLAGLCGLLAGVLPWFTPTFTVDGVTTSAESSTHAWSGYALMILGPAVLATIGIAWAILLSGRVPSSARNPNPARSTSVVSMVGGLGALAVGALALPVLHSKAQFEGEDGTYSWGAMKSLLESHGGALRAGPQIGLWLLLAGGTIMLATGVVTFAVAGRHGPAVFPNGLDTFSEWSSFGHVPPSSAHSPFPPPGA